MKRKIYQRLLDWKNDFSHNKPFMLLGARQVGKTYIVREFCKNEFENFIEINLFRRQDIIDLYNERSNSDEKFEKLKFLLDFDIEKKDTVLFIDEIQESEALISELKYFCEEHNNVRVIVAGSLLGVKLKRSKFSFPVGKVWMHTMYPMDFEEFLIAMEKEKLVEEIKKCFIDNKPMLGPIHKKALEYYNLFLITGGMPESVKNLGDVYPNIINYDKKILESIKESYFKDMDKYVVSNIESLKIENTYNSIPTQLSNLSHKFQYNVIEKNARSRDYELALDWLIASNLILKCYQVSNPQIPLAGFVKNDFFKIFLSDVGLLVKLLNIDYKDIIMNNISSYKGIIAENYVANQLIVNEFDLYYWVDSTSEVDFVIYTDDGIIPVEVKSSENTKSKSLNVYINKYNPKYAIRISSKNFGFKNNIKSVPLYAVFCINRSTITQF